jgi:2-dehydro-3-deoxyphosphooctonate aldolase (KDO 8-P synthase)
MSPRTVSIGPVRVPGDAPLFLIAGPCVLESRDHAAGVAEAVAALTARLGIPFVFKSSYDKANRTAVGSFRGPGAEEGLRILEEIGREVGVPVTSDVHTPEEVTRARESLDLLQIPAFLCRQTDLLLRAGESGKPVNVKKGQFLAPWDMSKVVEKIRSTGNDSVLVTERGTSFGYNRLVVDFTSVEHLRATGAPVVFDATHSVQLPGAKGDASGGERRFVPLLARAAAAAGFDGLFLEVHPDPDRAPCDGPNMIPLAELESLLTDWIRIREAIDRGTRG